MAFKTNTAAVASASTNNEAWKASGFINLYLPSKDGKRRKLGAIPLRENKLNEKSLLDWLNEDPSRIELIKDRLILDYQSTKHDPAHEFDLP